MFIRVTFNKEDWSPLLLCDVKRCFKIQNDKLYVEYINGDASLLSNVAYVEKLEFEDVVFPV